MIRHEAKLTTKKRKALASSSFCGPKRSFPVPDCKHVRAALSLLGRYKGPGNKAAIRACIYRKARSLKCFKKEFVVGEEAFDSAIVEIGILHREGMIDDESAIAFAIEFMELVNVCDHECAIILDQLFDGRIEDAYRRLSYGV